MIYAFYKPSFWGYLKGKFLNRVNERYTKAPHTIFTEYLDDTIVEQRKKGLQMGLELLKHGEELWLFGDEPSSGMLKEREAANSLGIPVVAVIIQQYLSM